MATGVNNVMINITKIGGSIDNTRIGAKPKGKRFQKKLQEKLERESERQNGEEVLNQDTIFNNGLDFPQPGYTCNGDKLKDCERHTPNVDETVKMTVYTELDALYNELIITRPNQENWCKKEAVKLWQLEKIKKINKSEEIIPIRGVENGECYGQYKGENDFKDIESDKLIYSYYWITK